MKKLALTLSLSLLFPVAALAAPPPGAPDPARDARRAEHREQMQKRMRMARILGLTEALNLNEKDALRMDQVMRRYDDQREPLRQQLQDAQRTVKAAAEGDNAAQGQLDSAIGRAFDARAQIAQIDRRMYEELARPLAPQQRARLAIFFAQFPKRMHEMMEKRMGEGRGGGGPDGARPGPAWRR